MLFRSRNQVKRAADHSLHKLAQNAGNFGHIDPIAQCHVTGEDVVQVDRVILVVGEAPSQAGLSAAIIDVGRESRGVIAVTGQILGERGNVVPQGRFPVDAQLMRPLPGEQARMRRQGPRGRRERQVEPHPAAASRSRLGVVCRL